MSLPWKAEFPQPGTEVVFDILARFPRAATLTLEDATQLTLPRVWITGKQVLCLSLTEDGRVKVEVIEGGQ